MTDTRAPEQPRLPEGVRALYRDEIDSTNTEAARLAGQGDTGPVWVFAGRQVRGRGRQERGWVSERGNLYASLLLTPDCPAAALHQLSLIGGVAAVDALRDAASGAPLGADVRLKWPNDVLVGTAKIAGILSESLVPGGGRPTTAIVGIGINLANHPDSIQRPATNLAALGLAVTPAEMLGRLAARMDDWLSVWRGGKGFAEIREAWLARAGALGEGMTINTGAGPRAGMFAGMDADGALLLSDASGNRVRYTFGDVALLPPAETK